jgi:hypothetical protein
MTTTLSTTKRFGLSARALTFARLYAEHPTWSVADCARKAGYADSSRAAHVRGSELLRDSRVAQAVMHFGSLAFTRAQALATARLELIAGGEGGLSFADRVQIRNLTLDIRGLRARAERLGHRHDSAPS